MTGRQLGYFLAGMCAVIGLFHLAQAAYIPTKAIAAQVLLKTAWARTVADEDEVKPWPWADTHPVARLRIPRLDVDQIVLAGATGRSLAFGPAHMDATAAPGGSGHAVITGHRDTHFSALRAIAVGDSITVERPTGETRTYHVIETMVADARTDRIAVAFDADRLTLITCYPFDAIRPGGPLRYVVTAVADIPPHQSLNSVPHQEDIW